MRPLLVLRPEPGTAATIARAEAAGLEAIGAPLFTVRPLAWDPPSATAHDALMLTSANAVRHAGPALDRYRALPLFAVGRATAAAARAAGFADIRTGPADAAALLDLMAAEGVVRPLHLGGREYHPVERPGVALTRRAVYAADPVAALPAAAAAALARGAVVLLHSPRAAALFAGFVGANARADIALVAISAAAATAADGGWRAVVVAEAPDDPALLAAAAALCE